MNTQLPDYRKPELLSQQTYLSKSLFQKLTDQVKWFREWIGRVFSADSKFKISKHKDSAGNELWKVYDANINHTVYLASEEEVRVWIEESFYGRHKESSPLNAFDLYQQRRFF